MLQSSALFACLLPAVVCLPCVYSLPCSSIRIINFYNELNLLRVGCLWCVSLLCLPCGSPLCVSLVCLRVGVRGAQVRASRVHYFAVEETIEEQILYQVNTQHTHSASSGGVVGWMPSHALWWRCVCHRFVSVPHFRFHCNNALRRYTHPAYR
jgi:hypothetical protein